MIINTNQNTWGGVVNHVYNLKDNTTNKESLNEIISAKISSTIFSEIKYKTNLRYSTINDYKCTALLEAVKDAYIKKYEYIAIITDNVKFINHNIIQTVLESAKKFNVFILNSNDIAADCVILNNTAIRYILNQNINVSIPGWSNILFNNISNDLKIGKGIDICYHPIDYIVTYVDNSDPIWLESYNKYKDKAFGSYNQENRWRAHDNIFRKHIELVLQNMSWVNNIYLVVSSKSQVPSWIDTNRITVITHQEIIPNEFLPTFNSRTIEMFLHNIPNLSEYFIYANDDMLVLNNIDKTAFVKKGKLYNLWETLQMSDMSNYHRACINSMNVCYTEFIVKPNTYIKFKHIPHIFKKSSCKHIYDTYKTEITTSITQFRSGINFNQYIYLYYDYYKHNIYEMENVISKYIDIKTDLSNIDIILNKYNDTTFLCINDSYIKKDIIKHKPIYATKNMEKQLKVAVCAIAKNENLYIREWVEWYKNLGVCKIFLYDNNDLDGEKIYRAVKDLPYYKDLITIINYRGKCKTTKFGNDMKEISLQGDAYLDCYKKHKHEFDYICYFDCDEFLKLETYKTISEFLQKYDSPNINGVKVNWKVFNDNNHVFYEPKTLYERFFVGNIGIDDCHIKTIVKTNIDETTLLFCAHGPIDKKLNFIDIEYNKPGIHKGNVLTNPNVYLIHYYTKTIEEFLTRKLGKTSAVSGKGSARNYNYDFLTGTEEHAFFNINKQTKEKLQLAENYIKIYNNDIDENIIISLTSYKERLQYVPKVIESILNQTVKPNKICLTLCSADNKYIPHSLMKMINNGIVELINVNEDIKPHKKYFYVMRKYRDSIIITIDDDVVYPRDLIETLYKKHIYYPDCVIARRVHKMKYNENNYACNYNSWIRDYTNIIEPSHDLFATGIGGILYPADCFKLTSKNMNDIVNIINADDIYLKWLELKNDIKVVYATNTMHSGYDKIEGSQTTALWKTNTKGNHNNDIYLEKYKLYKK